MTVLRARESGWGAFSASVSENRLLASLRSRLREMERSKAGAESDEPAELVQVRALVAEAERECGCAYRDEEQQLLAMIQASRNAWSCGVCRGALFVAARVLRVARWLAGSPHE